MNEMAFIEKLLDGAEVKWKALGEVTLPTNNIKWRDTSETYRYIDLTSVSIETKKVVETSEISSKSAPSRAQKLVAKNDVIFATTRPTQQRYCLIDELNDGSVASTGYCVLRANQECALPKWIWHWLSTKYFKNYLEENQSGSAYPAISDAKVREFKIPIPCPENPKISLEIQAEIVRILDTFTAVTSELTSELNARKTQYNHYRDKLLSFEKSNVEWKPLSEIGAFIRGKRFTKADYVEDGIPVIHYGEIYTRYGVWADKIMSQVRPDMANSLRYAKPGDVVITDVGETVEDVGKAVAWIGDDEVAIHDHCYAFRHGMNPKFVSYSMQTSRFVSQKAKYVARTKVNTLLIDGFSKIRIPVPTLEEQARIVAILDKFDTLTTSLTKGLPREIELRKKQYAHYRDLLLSFPKSKPSSAKRA